MSKCEGCIKIARQPSLYWRFTLKIRWSDSEVAVKSMLQIMCCAISRSSRRRSLRPVKGPSWWHQGKLRQIEGVLLDRLVTQSVNAEDQLLCPDLILWNHAYPRRCKGRGRRRWRRWGRRTATCSSVPWVVEQWPANGIGSFTCGERQRFCFLSCSAADQGSAP